MQQQNTESPRISVIVPMFNVSPYLDECLESLQRQSFSEFEALLVDNGSTDDTPAKAAAWCAVDPRMRLLSAPGGRQGHARNVGMAAARGAYFVFLDSDDWMADDALVTLYDLAERHHADIAACGAVEVWPDGRQEPLYFNQWLREGPCRTFKMLTRLSDTAVVWSKIYRRSLVEEYGLTFPEGVYFEDTVFNLDAVLNASRIVSTRRSLFFIRANPESTTRAHGNAPLRMESFFALADALLRRRQNPAAGWRWRRYLDHLVTFLYFVHYMQTPADLQPAFMDRTTLRLGPAGAATLRLRVRRYRLQQTAITKLNAAFPRGRELYRLLRRTWRR